MSSLARRCARARDALRWAAVVLLLGGTACGSSARTVSARDGASPLRLEREIALPGVDGRIDHLAIDLAGKRLFVAEVADGSAEVIDLAAGTSLARIGGLRGPQGIAWIPSTGEFIVACADGKVHFISGRDYRETAAIDLGSDADDVRADPRNGHVVVGYGEGGLAVIDAAIHRVVSRVTFKGHPEGFEVRGGKAWVNDPDDGSILALDLDGGKVLARWPTGLHRLNFPMALSADGSEISIVYRLPAALSRIDAADGTTRAIDDSCGDSDDLFIAGAVTLVVCGAGQVDLVEGDKTKVRVETRGGARTGLYVPEVGSLFVALPARDAKPAAIWQLRFSSANRPG